MTNFSDNGLITRDGHWIECEHTEHIATAWFHRERGPFVECKTGDTAEFQAWYTVDKTEPTQAQFNMLMDWCTAMEIRFEEAVDCWNQPWQRWLEKEV